MKFPEQYIKKGSFSLHSGEKSGLLYDVNAAIADPKYRRFIVDNMPRAGHYVGIATGGALIARETSQLYKSKFSFIHDREVKGEIPNWPWILVDDVTTTESSLREALYLIPTQPSRIVVVVDRRSPKNRKLEILSLFDI
jgi:orotate phosphoribosyltransferase